MSEPKITTFAEFWPYYVKAHSKPQTRVVHAVGTTAAVAIAASALLTGRKALLPVALGVGYGFAWYSHFFIEGNKPATFGHPLWSFASDFIMLKKTLDGTMDAEVERVTRGDSTPDASVSPAADAPLN